MDMPVLQELLEWKVGCLVLYAIAIVDKKKGRKNTMKKILKQTAAMLLVALLLTGNTGFIQSTWIDLVTNSFSNETVLTVKAAVKQQGKVTVRTATKKSKITAYNKKAKKAYKKFLKEYYVQGKSFLYGGSKYKWSDYKSSRKYTIRDINHDGKLELLIYNIGRPEHYLFTYYKGKVKCAAIAQNHSCFYECKKGRVIVESSGNNGSEENGLYLLQNGTLKCVGRVSIENQYTGTGRMKNGKIINEWR